MRDRLIALGILIAAATALSAQPAYRLHDSGELWVAKAENCRGTACVVWHLLDNHPMTREITAGNLIIDGQQGGPFDPLKAFPDAAPLYQRRDDGTIWLYTGKPCSGGACPGWQQIGGKQPTVSIVAAGLQLYQRHSNGSIWSYTGTPCSDTSCWQLLDNNADTVEITAAGLPPDAPRLYQRRKNGEILRYSGTPCSGASCWQLLDKNLNAHLNTREITATVEKRSDGTPGHALYERRDDGIWRYTERPCNGTLCPAWEQIDNDSGTISIVTNQAALYQLRQDGSILVHNKKPCQDWVCPGWVLLDKNPRTRQIAAGVRSVYKLHDNGAIWRYPEPQHCSDAGCPAWQLLYDPTISTIVSTQN